MWEGLRDIACGGVAEDTSCGGGAERYCMWGRG